MRYPPLLIARFIAMLLKPFAEGTGATIRGSLFLTLVFATLIYALRYTRTLAFCLTVLGVATVARSVFWPISSVFQPWRFSARG